VPPADPSARRRGGFGALRSTPFRWHFAGQIASASGTFVQQTGRAGERADIGHGHDVAQVPELHDPSYIFQA